MTSNNARLNLPENSVCPVRIVAPYPITHEFKATQEFVGKTLLEMMCTKFPFRTKSEWNKRIEEGRVFLENRDSKPDTILTNFDEIRHHNPAVIEPSVPDTVRIIEETDSYLAVFKPAPMPMHPGGRYFKNTLKSILEEKGFEGLKITHRLDAVTSGIVLFAKNKEFAKQVMQAFMTGNVEKEYHATVFGVPTESAKTIQSKIRRKHGFVFESGGELDSGQVGITHFEVISSSPETNTSLIRCNPITGRTHQIRLHLAEWGYPIIDDPIYGPNGDRSSRKTQNVGISLISKQLYIPSLGINVKC
ncbi:MAG: pseudouridine synthase [bacterium]|nr:pseudouridine synthase [bacterium]